VKLFYFCFQFLHSLGEFRQRFAEVLFMLLQASALRYPAVGVA
jgi:hypothetical protein